MKKEHDKLVRDICLLDAKIEDLREDRNNYGNIVFIIDWMLKTQYVFLLIGILGSFLYSGFLNLNNFLISAFTNGVYGALWTVIIFTILTIFFEVGKIVCTNKFKKIETEILKSEDLKHEYEKKLRIIKENKQTIEDTKKNDISFDKSKELVKEVILGKNISEASKPKRLTLKKKK